MVSLLPYVNSIAQFAVDNKLAEGTLKPTILVKVTDSRGAIGKM